MTMGDMVECVSRYEGAELLILAGVLGAWGLGLLMGRALWRR